jgi:hypothetical protein
LEEDALGSAVMARRWRKSGESVRYLHTKLNQLLFHSERNQIFTFLEQITDIRIWRKKAPTEEVRRLCTVYSAMLLTKTPPQPFSPMEVLVVTD